MKGPGNDIIMEASIHTDLSNEESAPQPVKSKAPLKPQLKSS